MSLLQTYLALPIPSRQREHYSLLVLAGSLLESAGSAALLDVGSTRRRGPQSDPAAMNPRSHSARIHPETNDWGFGYG